MRKKILQLIVILVAFCQMQALAQTKKVTGRVVGSDNNPVPGATVSISGTQQSTVTDADGNFSIEAPAGASLLISSIGSNDQVVKVDGRSVINVTMTTGDARGLEEVVVTGYTAQRKKDIVGAVAVVDVKALKSVPSGSAMSALQGQAAGVNVINNGSPGTPSQITIRGITGFVNGPLVLIDGVQGNMNDVPAIDVESIQVLKDASAAAIYGARGSNGVIVITTKKGKSGAPQVVYDSYYNLQIPRSLDKLGLLSTQQYGDIYRTINPATEIFANGGVADYLFRQGDNIRGAAMAGDPRVDPSNYFLDPKNPKGSYIIQKVVDDPGGYYDALTRNALMMQHNVTASGATDRASYMLSLGYLDQEGTVVNSYMRRYNARINTMFKIREGVRIGENVNLQYRNAPNGSIQNQVVPANGGFGPLQAAINTPSFLPVYDIAGNWGGTYASPAANAEVGDWGNAVAVATENTNNRNREYGIAGNAYLEIDFLKHFMFKTLFGGTIDNYYRQRYYPRQYWSRNGQENDEQEEFSGFSTTSQWTNTVTYKNTFGKHNLTLLAGTEAVEQKYRQLYGRGDGFYLNTPNYLVLQQAGIKNWPPSNGNGNAIDYVGETALFSLIGRADYNFNDKFLATFTARRDGYSRFGLDNLYGNFYSIGLGWVLTQENFMKNVGWVNYLKLRGSYGELGNKEGVPAGNAYSTYSLDPRFSYYDLNGSTTATLSGFYPLTYGNSRTSWENNKQTNVGFDATLFNNKFDLSVEYFNKRTDGLLRRLDLPATGGEATSPYVNVGDIENKGIDLSAAYHARISKDLTLNFGVNFTQYKNKIIDLPDPGYYPENNLRFEEGYEMGSYYGYKIVGIAREQKDLDESAVQQDKALGRWLYQDTDGNDTINAKDRVHLGSPNPDFTAGIIISGTWKNFDFNLNFYSVVGQDVWNDMNANLAAWESGPGARSKKVLDAWSPSNPNGTWKVAEQQRNFSNSSDYNDQYIEKGSFIRLRNIQVGYNFSGAGLKRAGLTNVRVFVGGTNLFLITKYSGLDPEIYNGSSTGLNGNDAGGYTQAPGVVGGLRVTF